MKKFAILMSVVMLLTLTAGFSFAAEKTAKLTAMKGMVVKLDAAKGEITIKSKGKEHALKAEAKMLEGIAVGDKVIVEEVGATVKSIKKAPVKKAEAPKKVEAPKAVAAPPAPAPAESPLPK